MSRKKTIMIEDDVTEAASAQPSAATEIESDDTGEESSVIERLADLMESTGADCISRIYKEDMRKGGGPREFIERVDSFVEEDYLAETYGPGRYVIRYEYKRNGERKKTTIPFAISGDYRPKNGAAVPMSATVQKDTVSAFLSNLNAEKVAGIMAAIQGIKAIFAPPPPPVDLTELLKAVAAPRTLPVSDAVLIKAMDMQRPLPPPQLSLLEQVKQVNQIKELLGAENESAGGDSMDTVIKIGLSMLPALLQKNGGNYQATGAAARENPMIRGLIENDPELMGKFCEAAANRYGEQAARELADGFGYTFEPQAAEAPQPQQIEQKQAQEPPKG